MVLLSSSPIPTLLRSSQRGLVDGFLPPELPLVLESAPLIVVAACVEALVPAAAAPLGVDAVAEHAVDLPQPPDPLVFG